MSKWRGRTYYLTDEIDVGEFVRGIGGLVIVAAIVARVFWLTDFAYNDLSQAPDIGSAWNWVLFITHIPQNPEYHWWEWPNPWASYVFIPR